MPKQIVLFIYFSLLPWIDLINGCVEILHLLYVLFNKLYSELRGICLFLPFIVSFLPSPNFSREAYIHGFNITSSVFPFLITYHLALLLEDCTSYLTPFSIS